MNTTIILKDKLESDKIEPTHKSVEEVSIYLLKTRGYDATTEWVKKIYGSDFRSEDTKEQLRRIVNQQGIDHISVPE
jgi:hypothetical protein